MSSSRCSTGPSCRAARSAQTSTLKRLRWAAQSAERSMGAIPSDRHASHPATALRRPTLGTKDIGELSKSCWSSILRRRSRVEFRRRRRRRGALGSNPMRRLPRHRSWSVTALPLARQQLGSTDLPRRFMCLGSGSMPMDDAGETLDAHWAVAVFEPADRKSLLALAESVRRQILSGTWEVDSPVSEQLLPLSSAYELAARERLDLFGIGHPNTTASAEQRSDRAKFLETGARRAFDLGLAIPLDDTDAHGVLYHTL